MKGASRKNIDTAGGLIIQGSDNVFVNGASAVRIGDAVQSHDIPPHDAPVMAEGSSTVFVNGIGMVRFGDAATCGHTATGSDNVFVGD